MVRQQLTLTLSLVVGVSSTAVIRTGVLIKMCYNNTPSHNVKFGRLQITNGYGLDTLINLLNHLIPHYYSKTQSHMQMETHRDNAVSHIRLQT